MSSESARVRSRRKRQRRTLEERLLLRFPGLMARVNAHVLRLPPGSRLRRSLVMRSFRTAYQAFSRGDFDAAFARLHPDVEWHTPANFPDAEILHGRDAVLEWYGSRWVNSWDWWETEPERIVDRGGGTMIVHAVTRGRGRASGIEVELRDVDVYEIRSGWAVRVRELDESPLAEPKS
jgi:ketosteroid isomerase-like protein